MYKKYYPFPSPIGVLYISIFKENRHGTARRQFPSPIGVLYISMKYLDVAEYVKEKQVSVPYWGSLYFNTESEEIKMTNLKVSVPYWGSLYFNSIKDSIRIFTITVSVPYWGSLYFNKGKKTYEEEMTSFRPLLGFFIFQ